MKSLALRPAVSALPLGNELPTAANLRAYAFRYMLRGSVAAVAALGQYTLEQVHFAAPWLTWVVLMPTMGMVISLIDRRQREAGLVPTTAADKRLRLLQKSFLLVILLALGAAPFIGWQHAHPLMLAMYGASTVAAGRLLNFRPLRVGGGLCALLGAVAAAVPADTQLLLIAAAMLVSYVVPGYLLRAAARLA
ncbi:hypothetical protein GCM10022408_22630 [Hymenobacter fastidiosus]|uniref:Uncharacterized protein n=1 Tax=Hymenobacter fastidiosus TaxID=486264 RepID=A0ABP7SCP2_9BACT